MRKTGMLGLLGIITCLYGCAQNNDDMVLNEIVEVTETATGTSMDDTEIEFIEKTENTETKFAEKMENAVIESAGKMEDTEMESTGTTGVGQLENVEEDSEEHEKELGDAEFVIVREYIPDIALELRYATTDNFTGQIIYDFDEAYLRYGTVKKLLQVQEKLAAQGMALKLWDAYRPVEAQFQLWEVCPDAAYVANPNKGYSKHSTGGTVDITLVYTDGTEVEMPTEFDDFSKMADRDYSDCGELAAGHAELLERLMAEAGFMPYKNEWWHFSDEADYPVEKELVP